MKTVAASVASILVLVLAVPCVACSTCGCSLNGDWISQGYILASGFHMDLRFDYIDQDQLRTGTGVVDTGAIRYPTDQEIQLRTISRSYFLDLGYNPNDRWGFDLLAPVIDRTHSTIAEGDVAPSYSHSSGMGDVRLLGRYQGFTADRSFGLQFGVKLPTGRTDDRFESGPQAGLEVDRGLQLGTGTTDLLLGIYRFGPISPNWTYFAQALAQLPLDSSQGFRPGDALNVNAGVRYTRWSSFVPQLQLNARAERPETGANADTANSGSTAAYLSPGITATVGHRTVIYAFVQLPVYQRVTGYQLEPRWLLSAGIHYRF